VDLIARWQHQQCQCCQTFLLHTIRSNDKLATTSGSPAGGAQFRAAWVFAALALGNTKSASLRSPGTSACANVPISLTERRRQLGPEMGFRAIIGLDSMSSSVRSAPLWGWAPGQSSCRVPGDQTVSGITSVLLFRRQPGQAPSSSSRLFSFFKQAGRIPRRAFLPPGGSGTGRPTRSEFWLRSTVQNGPNRPSQHCLLYASAPAMGDPSYGPETPKSDVCGQSLSLLAGFSFTSPALPFPLPGEPHQTLSGSHDSCQAAPF
jgi:hypothetical protein